MRRVCANRDVLRAGGLASAGKLVGAYVKVLRIDVGRK